MRKTKRIISLLIIICVLSSFPMATYADTIKGFCSWNSSDNTYAASAPMVLATGIHRLNVFFSDIGGNVTIKVRHASGRKEIMFDQTFTDNNLDGQTKDYSFNAPFDGDYYIEISSSTGFVFHTSCGCASVYE